MPLPDELSKEKDIVSTQEMIEEFESKPDVGEWDGITDAFVSVRGLIDGENSIVSKEVYEKYRNITGLVLSRVSLVRSNSTWAFFCLTAGSHSTPRWVYFDSDRKKPTLDLDEITLSLREKLTPGVESLKIMDWKSEKQLNLFVSRLANLDRELLPRKQQRALKEMEIVLSSFQKKSSEAQDQEALEFYSSLLDILKLKDDDRQPDWDYVSTSWLDLVRPIWHEFLPQTRKKIPMLKDIRSRVINAEEMLRPKIYKAYSKMKTQKGLDERIKACVIGLSK